MKRHLHSAVRINTMENADSKEACMVRKLRGLVPITYWGCWCYHAKVKGRGVQLSEEELTIVRKGHLITIMVINARRWAFSANTLWNSTESTSHASSQKVYVDRELDWYCSGRARKAKIPEHAKTHAGRVSLPNDWPNLSGRWSSLSHRHIL